MKRLKIRPDDPPPRRWRPLRKVEAGADEQGTYARWTNRWYDVTERPDRLLIVNADQSARRDWREFQAIKNQLWGDDAEAVELYPSESRKLDPSNAFMLYRLTGELSGRLGVRRRTVLGPHEAIAPQRRFARGLKV